tara:strand:+ start:482 stop:826 length:345 start_codon:yes stop_codon:yes gene_type:complete
MRGISKEKADQNAIRYRGIYEKWQTEESITLEQLGKEHEVTKQRMWQIITRCKLGNGDYYYGVNVARDKWSELYSTYRDKKQTRLAFNEWLENNQIKLIGNNKTTAPHTGWDLL